jgi:RNA ligase
MAINSIQDISNLLISGFTDWGEYGAVYTKTNGDLTLFNYATQAMYGGWSYFERVSRGLIINNKTGKVVARPFDKFHNWLEGGRKTDAPIKTITEKKDGSMVFTYLDNGFLRMATRGSFESEQALWATARIHNALTGFQMIKLESLCQDYTFIFEAIYPENRIVVNYDKHESGLYLLAIRNHHTGEYLSRAMIEALVVYFNYAFYLPNLYFMSLDSILAKLPKLKNAEGFVVEFEDGQRFKFKSEEYLTLHRLISEITFKKTLEAIRKGEYESYIKILPEEHLVTVMEWASQITAQAVGIATLVEQAWDESPKGDRKSFALWVNANYKYIAPYLFGLYDGKIAVNKLYDAILQKHQFEEGE